MKEQQNKKIISKQQQQALTVLINVAELAQSKGLFNLKDAADVIQSINLISPLLTNDS